MGKPGDQLQEMSQQQRFLPQLLNHALLCGSNTYYLFMVNILVDISLEVRKIVNSAGEIIMYLRNS